jgi:hypothetical protein
MDLPFNNGCAAFFKVTTSGQLQPSHIWLWACILASYKRDTWDDEKKTPNIRNLLHMSATGSTKWDSSEIFYRNTLDNSTLNYTDVTAILTRAGAGDSSTHAVVVEHLRVPTTSTTIYNNTSSTSSVDLVQQGTSWF